MVKRSRNWRAWIAFVRWALVAACVLYVLNVAGFRALGYSIAWTAMWTKAAIDAVRRARSSAGLGGDEQLTVRKTSKWVFAPKAILVAIWLSAGAIVVGIAWGPITGLAVLYLELVAAKATIIVAETASAYSELFEGFALNQTVMTARARDSTIVRWWSAANRPLPPNAQVIAGLSFTLVGVAVIVAYTHGPWWLELGMAFLWVLQCLNQVRKQRGAARG